MTERHIAIGGVQNLRDLGGYPTADGRYVTASRRIFRCDTLARIVDDVVAQRRLFDELKVGYAIDFRAESEIRQNPYNFDQLVYVNLPLEYRELFTPLAEATVVTEELCTSCMVNLYEHLALKSTQEFGVYLRLLLQHCRSDKAVVIHCTAGKDRTGFASFLFLALMGVPMDVIMDDFLLTNKLLHSLVPSVYPTDKPAWADNQAIREAMHCVKPEYLQGSINAILSNYTDVADYVMSTMNISEEEIETLRKAYLVPVEVS